MLRLGCSLLNLANICSQNSADAEFYSITEIDGDLLETIQKDVGGGLFTVFTPKGVVDQTNFQKCKNICKAIVGFNASQLYPSLMCQSMPTCFYTHCDLDSETSRFTPRQNKTRSFEKTVLLYFQRKRRECKIESFFMTGRQKNLAALVLMGSKLNAQSIETLCSKPCAAFTFSVPFKKYVPLSLERIFNVVARR